MSTELKPGETDKLWTISNIITLVRICLVPVFVVALITPWPTWFSITGVSSTTKSLIAALIFILISCTDWLDGYLARSRGEVTNFGKFMDPLADKCLVMAALCCFVEQGDMLAWILAIVLVREFAVSGMRLVAVEKGRVIAAAWSGKIKTASTMVCICLILFGIPHWLNIVCQIVILVTTVYSGVEYFVKNADVFKTAKEA